MADIKVQRVADPQKRTLPVFGEMEAVLGRIRNRAFEMFSGRGSGDGHALDDWLAAEREICWPTGELVEEDKAYTLRLAVPGFEPGDISVTATPHDVIVHAKAQAAGTKEPATKKGEKVCWSEFRSNNVYRQVDLPRAIDPQSVSASLQNGLLKVVATKTEMPVRVVSVRSAAS